MSQERGQIKFSSSAIAKQLAQIAIVFAAYFVAGKIGQSTANIRSGNLGPVWPAYGVALAAMLLCGYRVSIGVMAGAFLIALWSPVPALAAAGQALGATLAAMSGAYLLRRLSFQPRLERLRDALLLVVIGGFGSALISASIGSFVLWGTHVQAYSGMSRAWLIYWLGDSTGVLLITPLILTLPKLLKILSWDRRAEFVALFLLLIAASLAVFSDLFLIRLKLDVLAFAVLPFVMWAAIRFGMSGATLASFVIAALGTTETALGSGPFAHNSPFTNAVLLDIFFTVLSVSGMALAAVIAEREWAQKQHERLVREQAAMEIRLRLATIVESSDDAIIGLGLNGTITDWNKGAETLYGYSPEEAIGKPIALLIPPERGKNCHNIMEQLLRGSAVRHYETVRRRKDGTHLEVSLTGSPILTAEGQVVGISSIERNITERKRQEEILRNSEERFRLAAHAGQMFAYEWDAASDVIESSAESSKILGISESERLTGEQALASVHPEDRGKLEAAIAALSPEKPYLRVSYRIMRADGPVIWVDRHSIAHFDEKGRLLRMVGMIVDITERKRAEEALAKARSRLIEAQEQERTRIARELHDDIGQRITLLTVKLEQLQRSASGTEVGDRISELWQEAFEMAADIQSLSHELHSARLEYLGIAAAVRSFCQEFAENQEVQVDCSIHDLPAYLEPAISLCLFRVLQEALHNSLKHSGVERFEVRLWATLDQIHLTVSDSGAGFDSETARESQGLGLISMEERVKLLNGQFLVASQPNRGTTIHACVPLPSDGRSVRAAG